MYIVSWCYCTWLPNWRTLTVSPFGSVFGLRQLFSCEMLNYVHQQVTNCAWTETVKLWDRKKQNTERCWNTPWSWGDLQRWALILLGSSLQTTPFTSHILWFVVHIKIVVLAAWGITNMNLRVYVTLLVCLCGMKVAWELDNLNLILIVHITHHHSSSLSSCFHSAHKYTQTLHDLWFTEKAGFYKTQNTTSWCYRTWWRKQCCKLWILSS